MNKKNEFSTQTVPEGEGKLLTVRGCGTSRNRGSENGDSVRGPDGVDFVCRNKPALTRLHENRSLRVLPRQETFTRKHDNNLKTALTRPDPFELRHVVDVQAIHGKIGALSQMIPAGMLLSRGPR